MRAKNLIDIYIKLMVCLATIVRPSSSQQPRQITSNELDVKPRTSQESPFSRWLRSSSKYHVIKKTLNRTVLLGSDLYIPCLMASPIGWLKGDYILYMDNTMMYDGSTFGSGNPWITKCLHRHRLPIKAYIHFIIPISYRQVQIKYQPFADAILSAHSQRSIYGLGLVLLSNWARGEIPSLRHGELVKTM